MMAGNAFSTRTGSALSLAFAPQTSVPVYASLVRMLWTLVLAHSLPLGLAMPSLLRVRMISSVPSPASAMSNMRLTMRDASGSISRVGLFFGPSCTMTRL